MEKRKATIEKGATLKINTGGFENLEIFQSIKCEVEFSDGAELRRKSDALMRQVIDLLKTDAEEALKRTNRKRVVGNQAVELW
jgi:hypothetical protein